MDGGVERENRNRPREGGRRERERGLDVEKLVIKEVPTRGYITERRSFSNLVILSTNPLFCFFLSVRPSPRRDSDDL